MAFFDRAEKGFWLTLAAVAAVALAFELLWPGYYNVYDNEIEYYPGYAECARAWLHGEVPILSRDSWFCVSLAGELQFAVFSPLQQALLLLTYPIASAAARMALLGVFYVCLAATGAYQLARCRGLGPAWSASAAFTVVFNGWFLHYGVRGWMPLLSSFAWLPWCWWALETRRYRLFTVTAALLVLAGFPYVYPMLGLVFALLLVRDREPRRLLWGALVLGLTAPAWLMLLQHTSTSSRYQGLVWFCRLIPWKLALGAFLPGFDFLRTPADGEWLNASTDFCVGLVPVLGLLLRPRGGQRAPVALLALAFVLALSPASGGFRWSVRWFPLIGLTLALAGNERLERLAREHGPNPGLAALALTSVATLLAAALWGASAHLVVMALPVLGLSFIWASLWRAHPDWRGLATAAVCLANLLLGAALAESLPDSKAIVLQSQAMNQAGPFERDRRYLSLFSGDFLRANDSDALRLMLRPGNLPMQADLDFVNGYSPLHPRPLADELRMNVQGWVDADVLVEHSRWKHELGPDGLLASWGVDGLVISPEFPWSSALASGGWKVVAEDRGVKIWHRDFRSPQIFSPRSATGASGTLEALPLLGHRPAGTAPAILAPATQGQALSFAAAQLSRLDWERNQVSVDVSSQGPEPTALVVFARIWDPGYRAFFDGKELPVSIFNTALPAVVVPSGRTGRLTLIFRPRQLELGVALACVSLLVFLALSVRRRR